MSSQKKGMLSLLLVTLILLLAVVVLFLVVFRESQVKRQQREREVTKDQIDRRVSDAAIAAGIDPDELQAELDAQREEEKQKRCMVKPNKYGVCSSNYTLEGDCCYPDESAPPDPMREKIDLAINIAEAIGYGVVAEYVVTKIAMKSFGGGAKAGATAAKAGATATKTGATAAKAAKAAKSAAAAARSTYSAARAAMAAAGKYATAAAGGPVGLAIAVAMLVFDVISITIDLLDLEGYDSYTSNDLLTNIKNVIDYETAKALEQAEVPIDYPMLFPIAQYYESIWTAAQEHMFAQMEENHLFQELEKDARMTQIFDDYIQQIMDNPDEEIPVPQEFIDFTVNLNKRLPVQRDRYIFQKMQELMGSDKYKIELYEELSTADRVGISLSERAAKEWNEQNREIWLANNDLFNPPATPPLGEDPPCALYTDTYYVYESGPSDKPVMVPRKLPVKTVISGYYGTIISFCEKKRQIKNVSEPVDPYALGVRFDYETGVCKFTRDFCRRYGMEFKNNNCQLKPGQEVAEMIFGTTVTRGVIREWEGRIDDFKSGDPVKVASATAEVLVDLATFGVGSMAAKALVKEISEAKAKKSKPAKKGACPPGMRDDGMNCYLDPVYRGPGKPMGCKDDEEKKGQLCYPKCREGYNSSALECEGTCPDGSTNTGLTCLQSIHAYIPGNKSSNPFEAGFYERADCRDGYKYRGTTCNEECLPNFTFRSGAAGSAFCDKPRNRYSRAGQAKPLSGCPEGHEKQGLLCYPKCSNKGDQGQYKYNGVLDWCQPEGGAGIKKGLDDRWECPEGWDNKAGICYEKCPEGYRDDGLLCNKQG